jgi:hypothetical protein
MNNLDKLAAKDESIEDYSGYDVDGNDCDLQQPIQMIM